MKKAFLQQDLILLGETDLDLQEDAARYANWLAADKAASMDYLKKNVALRENPRLLLDGAKRALVFGFDYSSLARRKKDSAAPKIAAYAGLKDYHRFMKKRATLAMHNICKDMSLENFGWRVCVDSAPILERALARKTGAEYIGKNSMFISYEYGSYVLLGVVLLTQSLLVLENKASSANISTSCGTCRRCQVHCPTGALSMDYQVDASRCLSYWTIEHRGPIPLEFWPHLARYWYGCDLCQDVCPKNRIMKSDQNLEGLRVDLPKDLMKVALMTEREYEIFFGGTALTRAKRDGLRRNAIIAMAAIRDERLGAVVENLRNDSSVMIQETLAQLKKYPSFSSPASPS